MYAIAEDAIYLYDLLEKNTTILQTKVKCKNLLLENEDGTERVEGLKEYELLKEACHLAGEHGSEDKWAVYEAQVTELKTE